MVFEICLFSLFSVSWPRFWAGGGNLWHFILRIKLSIRENLKNWKKGRDFFSHAHKHKISFWNSPYSTNAGGRVHVQKSFCKRLKFFLIFILLKCEEKSTSLLKNLWNKRVWTEAVFCQKNAISRTWKTFLTLGKYC